MKAKPFVKWVGGKRNIMKSLLTYTPTQINNYYEPFVGGGALFFEIANRTKHSYLSDLNADLITCYQTIKTKPLELIEALKTHKENHCKDYFYATRSKQDLKCPVKNTARFIYLLATCFNGLYRVNKNNIFNAAFGYYENSNILDENNIKSVYQVLQNATITHQDFALNLSKNGINVMISNSNTDFIKNLYKNDFEIIEITTSKSINPTYKKPTTELLIRNYDTFKASNRF